MSAPDFAIVRGAPDEYELAALTAVLMALRSARTATAGEARPAAARWVRPAAPGCTWRNPAPGWAGRGGPRR